MSDVNREMVADFILTDPETGEELRPIKEPICNNEFFIIDVSNKSGTRKWRHSIKTEEI